MQRNVNTLFTLTNALSILTIAAALTCGLMAGVFFAFSTFVMKGLARISASEGIAAMQGINLAVSNSLFLVVFMLTPLICIAALVLAIMNWQGPASMYIVVGCILYVVGNFVVTAVCNVPMNDALAAVSPTAPESAAVWSNYITWWTIWNHVRTITAFLAMGAFILGLRA